MKPNLIAEICEEGCFEEGGTHIHTQIPYFLIV